MLTAVIDLIDGPQARVIINDDVAVAIPLHELPPRVREGMVLRLKFSIDQGATVARDAAVKRMAGDE